MIIETPVIRTLPEDAIHSILLRNHVGRLAFVVNGEIDIRPLHYVYSRGVFYCRTSPEARLSRLEKDARVVFEVDEVHSVFSWKSVLARGECRMLQGADEDPTEWGHACELLRMVVKHTMEEGDPVPSRTVVLRIAVRELTGKACG